MDRFPMFCINLSLHLLCTVCYKLFSCSYKTQQPNVFLEGENLRFGLKETFQRWPTFSRRFYH